VHEDQHAQDEYEGQNRCHVDLSVISGARLIGAGRPFLPASDAY
jgi:hypothetical protein